MYWVARSNGLSYWGKSGCLIHSWQGKWKAGKAILEKGGTWREHATVPISFKRGRTKQRIGIARALCVFPNDLLQMSALSALDVSIQSWSQSTRPGMVGITYLFIAIVFPWRYSSNRLRIIRLGLWQIEGTTDRDICQSVHLHTITAPRFLVRIPSLQQLRFRQNPKEFRN